MNNKKLESRGKLIFVDVKSLVVTQALLLIFLFPFFRSIIKCLLASV